MATEDAAFADDLFSAGAPYDVSQAERDAYSEQGYFIARHLVTPSLLAALAQRLDEAARGELDEKIHRQVERRSRNVATRPATRSITFEKCSDWLGTMCSSFAS